MTTDMVDVTTIVDETTKGSTSAARVRRRKPSIKWLKRELAEAREDLRLAGVRIDVLNIALTKKTDELMEALNKRDEAREDRDLARQDASQIAWIAGMDRQDCRREKNLLCGELMSVRNEKMLLADENQRNFDKAVRNENIAAVLASLVIAETDKGPSEIVHMFIEIAEKMGISPKLEIDDEVGIVLKRGYAAQVDQVIV